MSLLQIEKKTDVRLAFLHLGFRPFFAGAIGLAVLAMLAWAHFYFSGANLPAGGYPGITWHAHEMIFGYGMAVASGFLLTGVKNWTGIQTINLWPLLAMFLLWLIARVLAFVPWGLSLTLAATADLVFDGWISVAITLPLWRTRQWSHSAFPGKLYLMLLANLVFYLGLLGYWDAGVHVGLYSGFYVILALIFTMGRRVIPYFIEKGVECPFTAKNYRWIDISSLFLFLTFAIADIVAPTSATTAVLAGVLFLIHVVRLVGWHTPALWAKPLLWSLFLGYAWIVAGFLLKVLSVTHGVSPFLAVHAFAYGGIGLITAGMMARVSLGHTGRNVFAPPKVLIPVFGLIAAGAVARVLLPLIVPGQYGLWIGVAQGLWILAFLVMFVVYLPILARPRIDGRLG